jgi:DNA-directed RNA polymerase subunit M/transcription elongation factor TFIIS
MAYVTLEDLPESNFNIAKYLEQGNEILSNGKYNLRQIKMHRTCPKCGSDLINLKAVGTEEEPLTLCECERCEYWWHDEVGPFDPGNSSDEI